MGIVPIDQTASSSEVFICYAHEDPAHKTMVGDFAEFLRHNGVDVVLDQRAEGERQDWDHWMRRAVRGSRYVLVIVSETVRRLADGEMPDCARGLRPELNLLRELYNGEPGVWPKRILPVLLPGRSKADIPSFLQPHNADHYIVESFTVAGAERLLRLLTTVPGTPAAPRPQPAPPPLVDRHWTVSARGTDLSMTEFWFTGRRRALAALADFTRDRRPGLLAVTGMPGAGKSALLGVCVLRSLAPGTLPPAALSAIPDCSVTVAVHARSKDADTVLAGVAAGLGGSPHDATDVRARLDRLINPGSPPVVVIDALDEAKDPGCVADAVHWLSARAVTLVGVRPDAPAGPDGAVLLPAALRTRHPAVVDLDTAEHRSERDVAAYVAQRLRADTGRPGGYGTPAWDMGLLVDVIGAEVQDDVAAGNFLIAQLVVEELLAMEVLGVRRRGWSSELHWPDQLTDWIRRDVLRRLGESAAAEARSTLAPVAHALRGGLTLDLWRALLPRFGSAAPPRNAIAEVTTRLGFYLTSPAPGQYAIRHEQFASYFTTGLLAGDGDDIFVDVLTGRVPRAGDGRLDWAGADDYTALNLLTHAHGAGRLAAVTEDQPACLARVDPLSAGTLLGAATEPWCRAAADVLRRAAYASSDGYGERASALQAHAALAGRDHLASALLSQAGAWMPWTVRWSAGTPDDAPVAVGGTERTQAALAVAASDDEAACLVVVGADGRCSVRDAASGQALGADVRIEPDDDEAPILRTWRTPSGSVHLAAGRPDGGVTVWALTGGSAGSVVWRCAAGPGLRDLARVAGPQGTDLIVVLAGGTLTVRPLRPFDFSDPPSGTLLDVVCPASRIVPLAPADRTAAFLTAGADADLTAWRLSARSAAESSVHRMPWLRTDAILADGDADRACVLSNAGQAVHSTWLTERLISAGTHRILTDGGRTARIALAVHDGAATAAVADGSTAVRIFDLAPDESAAAVSTHDIDDPVYHLAFVDRQATMLAVGGWPGTVTVLDVRAPGRTLRMGHGESGVTIHPLGRADDSWLMATRGVTGLTRVWQLPPAATSSGAGHPAMSSVCAVPVGDGRLLLVAAAAGDEVLRCWLVTPDLRRADPLPPVTHSGGVHAIACAEVAGRAWLATAGETGATLWAVGQDGVPRREAGTPSGNQDVEHVILGADPDDRLILGTAGPEHVELWRYDGEALTAVVTAGDDWVTAVAVERSDDRMLVVTGDDDGVLRLIEFRAGGSMVAGVVHEGASVVAVGVLASAGRTVVVAADRSGRLVAGRVEDGAAVPAVDFVPWQLTHLITTPATGGDRLFGVASTPPRLLGWVLDQDGDLRLDNEVLGELRGTPLHVARTASAVAVADGGGQLLLADAVTGQVTTANLNVTVDALAGVPGGDMFVAARGRRLICIAPGPGR